MCHPSIYLTSPTLPHHIQSERPLIRLIHSSNQALSPPSTTQTPLCLDASYSTVWDIIKGTRLKRVIDSGEISILLAHSWSGFKASSSGRLINREEANQNAES